MTRVLHISTATLFLALLFSSFQGKATHIIGGVMSYEYVGPGNTYRVTMKIYRDCNSQTVFDGGPGAPTVGGQADATVGVFDETNDQQVNTLNMMVTAANINRIPPPINNPCLSVPPGVCVEEGIYTDLITLPRADRTYYLAYQRCCRNGSIINIANPGSQGSTVMVSIPPTATYANNSAVFTNFPPTILCKDAPITFNHSASDVDGDVLVYSLCAPLNGADQNNPAPNPLAQPYTKVPFQNPYSATNPVGGNPVLSIDSLSGVITGKPGSVGQFLVGICVKEYRNGVLLNTTIRDFQFNVTNCNIPIVEFKPGPTNINPNTLIGDYARDCEDYTVNFEIAGGSSVWWNFGDPSTTSDVATVKKPSYTYPDTGKYMVTGVVMDANGCSDTAFTYVYIYPGLVVDYELNDVCEDSAVVFVDKSSYASGNITSWTWNFGDGFLDKNRNATHKYAASGIYQTNLVITTDRKCSKIVSKQVQIYPKPDPQITYTPLCVGTPIKFTTNTTVSVATYDWDLGNAQSSSDPDPTATYNFAGTYNLSLFTQTSNFCKDTQQFSIKINNLPRINLPDDTSLCPGEQAQLNTGAIGAHTWTPATYLSSGIIADPISEPDVSITYAVKVVDLNQCENFDTIDVIVNPKASVSAGLDTSVCLNSSPLKFRDSVQLNGLNTGPTAVDRYIWMPPLGLSDNRIPNPVAKPNHNQLYTLLLVDVNGCMASDSVEVFVLDPDLQILPVQDTFMCKGESMQIHPIDQGVSQYLWREDVGDISDPNVRNPVFTPEDTTIYTLTISNYCYSDSAEFKLMVFPDPKIEFTLSSDSICLGERVDIEVSTDNPRPSFTWEPHRLISRLATRLQEIIPDRPGTETFVVTVADKISGCSSVDSFSIVTFGIPAPMITVGSSILIKGQSTELWVQEEFADYRWNDADGGYHGILGDHRGIARIEIQPDYTTEYKVEVENEIGCIGRDSIRIIVDERPVVLLPTGFSPNGDGVNDLFRIIKMLNVEEVISFSVYNRWGEKVADLTDRPNHWDGTFQGVNQNVGTYSWMLDAKDTEGKNFSMNGNITLIR